MVFTEIDFADMTDNDRKKLFVGLTRAQIPVEMVLSPIAEACFIGILERSEA